MKPLVITRLEWKILALFAAGCAINLWYLHLGAATLVTLYLFGMFFEFTTEAAWNYNKALDRSTFTLRDRDVNWLFGLGWQATLITGLSLGRASGSALPGWPDWLCDGLGLFLVGNAMEQTFYVFGLYRYNPRHWIVTLWTGHPVELFHIPVAVRAGYFFMGVLIHFLVALTATWGC